MVHDKRFSNNKPTKKYGFLLVLQGDYGLFAYQIFFHEYWLYEFNMHSFTYFTVCICRNILELQNFSRKLCLHCWKKKVVFTFCYSFVYLSSLFNGFVFRSFTFKIDNLPEFFTLTIICADGSRQLSYRGEKA